jgi:hypothetical protein
MTKPIYLVEVQNRIGRYFIETDRDSNSLNGILDMIRSGEINPVKILEVDEDMNRVEDITEEVLAKGALPDSYRTTLTGEDKAAWDADRRRAIEMAE